MLVMLHLDKILLKVNCTSIQYTCAQTPVMLASETQQLKQLRVNETLEITNHLYLAG